MRREEDRLDWVHPPADAAAESLWAALHDARVHVLRFDRTARVAELEIDVPHLGLWIELRVRNVLALRATRWTFVEKRGERHVGIEESMLWEWLAAGIGEESMDVSNAALLREEGEIALSVEGLVRETYHRLFLRGEGLEVGGGVASVEELVARGGAYWDSLGAGG